MGLLEPGIIRDKAMLRALIETLRELSEEAYSEVGGADAIIAEAERRIFSIAENKFDLSFDRIRDVLRDNLSLLEQLSDNPDLLSGVKTQFEGLDRVLVGLGKGDLVLVGARPRFYLEEGEHMLTLETVREPIAIKSITLCSVEQPDSYEAYLQKHADAADYSGSDKIYIQAEYPTATSDRTIYQLNDRSSVITMPQDPALIKMNEIGGEKWQYAEQARKRRGQQRRQQQQQRRETDYHKPFGSLRFHRYPSFGSQLMAFSITQTASESKGKR